LATDAGLKLRAGSERERAREREEKLLAMFNEAAVHVTGEDLEERESLLSVHDLEEGYRAEAESSSLDTEWEHVETEGL
jgi:hypothetical protein